MKSIKQSKTDKKKIKGKIKLIFILGILILILIIMKGISGFHAAHKSANTTICINNLESIGKAVKSYKNDNDKYPEDLEYLVKKNYIKSTTKCPETNKDYLYKIYISSDTEYFEIYCPNPHEHKKRGRITYKEIKYTQGKGIVLIQSK